MILSTPFCNFLRGNLSGAARRRNRFRFMRARDVRSCVDLSAPNFAEGAGVHSCAGGAALRRSAAPGERRPGLGRDDSSAGENITQPYHMTADKALPHKEREEGRQPYFIFFFQFFVVWLEK